MGWRLAKMKDCAMLPVAVLCCGIYRLQCLATAALTALHKRWLCQALPPACPSALACMQGQRAPQQAAEAGGM